MKAQKQRQLCAVLFNVINLDVCPVHYMWLARDIVRGQTLSCVFALSKVYFSLYTGANGHTASRLDN